MATVIRSLGISGYPPGVKAAIIAGMAVTTIVGLGACAVKEAKTVWRPVPKNLDMPTLSRRL